jgi:hypothetical protein
MSGEGGLREGMAVYGADGELMGRVQRVHDGGLDVVGWHYGRDAIVRVEGDRVYVAGVGTTATAAGVPPSGDTEGTARRVGTERRDAGG